MRRSVIASIFILGSVLAVIFSGSFTRSFAQVGVTPQGDEFQNTSFTAPFTAICGQYATAPCPDGQSATTWSLDSVSPGYLRIMTQFGSLLGTAASGSNNARDLIVQPFSTYSPDFTVTTQLTFPASTTSVTALGQTAGIIVYQDDDNFLIVARTYTTVNGTPQAQLQFLQEINGQDYVSPVTESGILNPTVYLRLTKSGTSTYTAYYSYDNVTFLPLPATTVSAIETVTPVGTTTATPAPTATPTTTTSFTATYSTPKIGLFAWGGTNSQVVSNQLPADFHWFRVGPNSMTPGPVATGTITTTATTTLTPTPTNTPLPLVPTSTPTNTPIPTPSNTPIPTPTNTPIPTPTPRPPRRTAKKVAAFSYSSVWYHFIRIGTAEHIQVQAKSHHQQGIWAVVHFATGRLVRFYANTNNNGFWQKDFVIPNETISGYSPQAVVTFQLWYGHSTAKDWQTFAVVR